MPLKDLLFGTPAPTGLFQTRITHTPGGVAPVPDGTLAIYDQGADPQSAAAQQRDLTPQERQTLAKAWAPLGKGFITVPDAAQTRPATMKHEQFHDLQQKAGLGQYANQIAPLVEPGLVDQMKADPVYQRESTALGLTPTIADEGSAIELVNMGRKGTKLQDFITNKLNQQQKKQFSQLTGGE